MPYQTDHTHHTYPTYHTHHPHHTPTTPPPHHRGGEGQYHTPTTPQGGGGRSHTGAVYGTHPMEGWQGLVHIYIHTHIYIYILYGWVFHTTFWRFWAGSADRDVACRWLIIIFPRMDMLWLSPPFLQGQIGQILCCCLAYLWTLESVPKCELIIVHNPLPAIFDGSTSSLRLIRFDPWLSCFAWWHSRFDGEPAILMAKWHTNAWDQDFCAARRQHEGADGGGRS